MDRLVVDKRTALKMYWVAGFNTEELLLIANGSLEWINQPSAGYYYADDVSASIADDLSRLGVNDD